MTTITITDEDKRALLTSLSAHTDNLLLFWANADISNQLPLETKIEKNIDIANKLFNEKLVVFAIDSFLDSPVKNEDYYGKIRSITPREMWGSKITFKSL